MRLNDKIAIVTGGGNGIGRACAHRFALEGAKVVVADIDGDAARAAADAIADASGRDTLGLATDVRDPVAVAGMIDAAIGRFGRIDALVNNAAIVHGADFLDIDLADFDRVLAVNLRGVFIVAQAVARQMVAQGGGGAIVNMSSINATVAIPDQVPYVVAKGGINQLTKVMALSLARHSIRVNAIGPGSIGTEMLNRVLADEAARKKVLARTPLGRVGDPDEIARIAAFLVSEDSSYITGECLYADGGRLALNYTVPVGDG